MNEFYELVTDVIRKGARLSGVTSGDCVELVYKGWNFRLIDSSRGSVLLFEFRCTTGDYREVLLTLRLEVSSVDDVVKGMEAMLNVKDYTIGVMGCD